MPLTPDWIDLHYNGKSEIIYLESKRTGDFLVEKLGAEYLEKVITKMGTYYAYSIKNNLSIVYDTVRHFVLYEH